MHMHVNIVIIIILNILQINFVFINDDSSYLNNVHLSEREKVEVPCVRKAKGLWPLSRGAPQGVLKIFHDQYDDGDDYDFDGDNMMRMMMTIERGGRHRGSENFS